MKVINKLNVLLFILSGCFIGISTFVASINGILRYSINFNFPWAEELCTYLVVIMVFMMQPYLETRDEQLCIGFLSAKLKNPLVKKAIFIFRGLITIFILGLLVKYGIAVVERTYETKAVTYMLQIPRYLLYAITTGSFILVILGWLGVILLNKGEKVS